MSSTRKDRYSFIKHLFQGALPSEPLLSFPFFQTAREEDFRLMSSSIEDWIKENIDSAALEREKKLSPAQLQGLRDMGLFGLILPEKYGGSELSQTMYTRTLELLNKYDASLALTVGAHTSIGLKGLYLYGNEEQKRTYMPRLATGELIASFALTEPTAGSDVSGIKTRAVRDGDCYILNGSKLWITNGGFASFFTVFAKETVGGEDKITAFLVTKDMGEITTGPEEHKLGIRASSTVEVFFKNVRVPVGNVLGEPGDGFKIAMGILNQGRIGLAGGCIGGMKSVFDLCVQYANNRRAFGGTIGEFETIQNMILQMSLQIYASESLTYFTTQLVDDGHTDYSIEAAICKIYASEAQWSTLNTAMQLHGGNGYMDEYGIEKKLRDSRICLIFEGTNEILRLFIAMTGIKETALQYQRAGQEFKSIKNVDFLSQGMEKIGFLSDFIFQEVKKNLYTEKLTGFHTALEKECERFASAAHALSSLSAKLIRNYGANLLSKQLQLMRLADIAIQTYLIGSVLCRINTVLSKSGGVANNQDEYNMARLIIRNARAQIHQLEYDTQKNRDYMVEPLAKSLMACEKYPFSLSN